MFGAKIFSFLLDTMNYTELLLVWMSIVILISIFLSLIAWKLEKDFHLDGPDMGSIILFIIALSSIVSFFLVLLC